jgi:16S rRNA (guanine966-N2)-methyltransferase
MRIIAGRHRGRKLEAPPGLAVRPTSDRAREALFDILGHGRFAEQPLWLDARVLDAFAGTGAFGLEALSRGAAHATFVERDADAVRAIERNLDKLKLRATVLRQDALAVLAAETRKYDLVFVDPPYDMYPDLEAKLARYLPSILGDGAVVVVETDARVQPELPFEERTSRKYGSARITVYDA